MFDFFVGIDFSINSPAVCVFNTHEETYQFFSFVNDGGRSANKPLPPGMGLYQNLPGVVIERYSRHKGSKIYEEDQLQKIEDAEDIVCMIGNLFNFNGQSVCYGLEGFSYGSKGNSFIDLIMFNSMLRYAIWKNLEPGDEFKIMTPSYIKKNAGKGNANKNQMLSYFLDSKEASLQENDFWKFCSAQSSSLIDKNEKVIKPIDDLVDSYFICDALRKGIVPLKNC